MTRSGSSQTEIVTRRTLRLRRRQQSSSVQTNNVTESTVTEHLNISDPVLPRVSFTSDTINNEHLNKKKSNVCCIFKTGKNMAKNKYER